MPKWENAHCLFRCPIHNSAGGSYMCLNVLRWKALGFEKKIAPGLLNLPVYVLHMRRSLLTLVNLCLLCSTRGTQVVAREDPVILWRRLPLRSLEETSLTRAPIDVKPRPYLWTVLHIRDPDKLPERGRGDLSDAPLGRISCMLNDRKDGCFIFYNVS